MSSKNQKESETELEPNYRINEFARLVGYRESTIRRKIYMREIAFRKVGRILVIPRSEAQRLLQNHFPVVEKEHSRM